MKDSGISGLHRLSPAARLQRLESLGWLSATDRLVLQSGAAVLQLQGADTMVENTIAVFGLPLAIAANFRINDRDYLAPMVVEEPSVVAAVSNAAKLARPAGFSAECDDWLLAGQVHIGALGDATASLRALEAAREELLAAANEVHPRLLARGGGARDIEFRELTVGGRPVIAVHLLVDTVDAMGANLVNTICEALAPRLAEISNGEVALRILSNLSDRSVATATVKYSLAALTSGDFSGAEVRDRIVLASEIAAADPYRAATHNKGIMNGVDAVAIATGNDWRAIEAGAHAYAALDGHYRPLAVWSQASDGSLHGELSMPLRVATVGGTLPANPAARLALELAGVASSRELAQVMAAVGLAQNFAALRALSTEGIQKGHMRMHARVAAAEREQRPKELHANPEGIAAGKVIVMGEHAAVYGRHAVALPIPNAVSATVTTAAVPLDDFLQALLTLLCERLDLNAANIGLDVRSTLPPGMGLGVSAAVAVAVIRALNARFELALDDAAVNDLAYACEALAHGSPSGVDNTIATYATPMLFRNRDGLDTKVLTLPPSLPIVVALSGRSASTAQQIAKVRAACEQQPQHYERLFDDLDALSLAAAEALQNNDLVATGQLLNIGQGLLNAMQVSTPELEQLVSLTRAAGAAGAKLTGSGGGGSVIAICPGKVDAVTAALARAGVPSLRLDNGEEN